MTDNLKEVPAKNCCVCGSLFQPKKGGYNALYCSDHCKLNKNTSDIPVVMKDELKAASRDCLECGVNFTPSPQGYSAKFCSQRCKRKARYRSDKENKPEVLAAHRRKHYSKIKEEGGERIDRHRSAVKSYRSSVREWLKEYKLEKGCFDCGYRDHFAALELDHEGEKRVEISIARSSIDRLKAEIESGKCVVRCANCHAKKTWERKMQSSQLTCVSVEPQEG